MKITCSNVADFLQNLRSADSVYRNIVHFDRTSREISEVSAELVYQLSTVVEFVGGSHALLAAGMICGVDTLTADGEQEGSKVRCIMHGEVMAYCDEHNLKLLPGILDA